MGPEIRQLLCDLWELTTSEQEISGCLSKWEGQLADLKIMNTQEEGTSKWSTFIFLLSLDLYGVQMAQNVHFPSQAQIFS